MQVRFLPPELFSSCNCFAMRSRLKRSERLFMESALRKGKPIGDGSRLESGRALTLPSEFDSRSFRCNRKLCHWPIGKGASLPSWTGGSESHGLRSTNNNIVLWPSGEGTCLTNRGSTVRIRPGLLNNTAHRSSLEWTPPCHGGDHRFKSGMGR